MNMKTNQKKRVYLEESYKCEGVEKLVLKRKHK